jgi:hypothetical protein
MTFQRPTKRYKVVTGDKAIDLDEYLLTEVGLQGLVIDEDDKLTGIIIISEGNIIYDYQPTSTLEDFRAIRAANVARKQEEAKEEAAYQFLLAQQKGNLQGKAPSKDIVIPPVNDMFG